MADGTDGGSSAGDAASGGAGGNGSGAGGAQSDTGTIDYKALCADLEQKLAKATGKAGSTQADLTTQLHAANASSASEKARADKAAREVLEQKALAEILDSAPSVDSRKAIRLVAGAMLKEQREITPDADGTFAMTAKAIVDKITADAPTLFAAKQNVGTSPHVPTAAGSQPSGALLEINGKRIF